MIWMMEKCSRDFRLWQSRDFKTIPLSAAFSAPSREIPGPAFNRSATPAPAIHLYWNPFMQIGGKDELTCRETVHRARASMAVQWTFGSEGS
jgi:hypothetical protein